MENKWKTTDLDTTSVSSLEEWLHTDTRRPGSRKYVDKVTLMVSEKIPKKCFRRFTKAVKSCKMLRNIVKGCRVLETVDKDFKNVTKCLRTCKNA